MCHLRPGSLPLPGAVKLRADDPQGLQVGGVGLIPRTPGVQAGSLLTVAVLVQAPQPGGQGDRLGQSHVVPGGEAVRRPLAVGQPQLVEGLDIFIEPVCGGDVGELVLIGPDRGEGAAGRGGLRDCPRKQQQGQGHGTDTACHGGSFPFGAHGTRISMSSRVRS